MAHIKVIQYVSSTHLKDAVPRSSLYKLIMSLENRSFTSMTSHNASLLPMSKQHTEFIRVNTTKIHILREGGNIW